MSDKKKDLSIRGVDSDIIDYIKSTGISITNFFKMAAKEKKDRDSK